MSGLSKPNDQTVLLSVVSVVVGCHRGMVERVMECVEELGKAERNVEDRVQSTTSANKT